MSARSCPGKLQEHTSGRAKSHGRTQGQHCKAYHGSAGGGYLQGHHPSAHGRHAAVALPHKALTFGFDSYSKFAWSSQRMHVGWAGQGRQQLEEALPSQIACSQGCIERIKQQQQGLKGIAWAQKWLSPSPFIIRIRLPRTFGSVKTVCPPRSARACCSTLLARARGQSIAQQAEADCHEQRWQVLQGGFPRKSKTP